MKWRRHEILFHVIRRRKIKSQQDFLPNHPLPRNEDAVRLVATSSYFVKWRRRDLCRYVNTIREINISRNQLSHQHATLSRLVRENLLRNQLQRRRTQKINMSRNWLPHRHTMSTRLVKQNFRGITHHFNPLREGKSQRIRAKWHLSLHFTSVVTWPLIRG